MKLKRAIAVLAVLTFWWVGAQGARAASDKVEVETPQGTRQIFCKILEETWEKGVKVEVTDPEGNKKSYWLPLRIVTDVLHRDPTEDYARAKSRMAAGKYADAMKSYKAAYTSAPAEKPWIKPYSLFFGGECGFREAKYARATKADKDKFYGEAQKAYARLLKDYPAHRFVPGARLGQGIALMRLNQFDKARQVYTSISASGFAERYKVAADVWSGRLLVEEGKWDAAISALQKASGDAKKKYPDLGYLAMLAQAYAMQGKGNANQDEALLRRAESMFEKVGMECRQPAVKAEAFNSRGSSLLARGDQREALFSFLRVVVLHSAVAHEYQRALYYAAKTSLSYYDDEKRAKELARMLWHRHPRSYWAHKLKTEKPFKDWAPKGEIG